MVGIAGKFARPPAASATAVKRRASRYDGVSAASGRLPIPPPGTYQVEWVSAEETRNPGNGNESCKINLKVLQIADGGKAVGEKDRDVAAGDTVQCLQSVGTDAGAGRVKAAVMAAAGFDDEAAFDEAHPHGVFVEACSTGESEVLIGRTAFVRVMRGNPCLDKDKRPTGDYYREWEWAPDGEPITEE
jgi:hypothetical protein